METSKSSEGECIYKLDTIIYLRKILSYFPSLKVMLFPSYESHCRYISFCAVSELECFLNCVNRTASNTVD